MYQGGVRGLVFNQASTCTSTGENSSNFSLISPSTFLTSFLTAASHNPPKRGACSVTNFRLIFFEAQNSDMEVQLSFSPSSLISLSAPTKFVPWSFHMVLGIPRRQINRLTVAINAELVRSNSTSRWTALVVKQTNTATYAFVSIRACRQVLSWPLRALRISLRSNSDLISNDLLEAGQIPVEWV